jgi:hypothetical protein
MKSTTTLLTLALATAPAIAGAQQAAAPPKKPVKPVATVKRASQPVNDDAGDEGPDIVVTGAKPPGSVIGDIPPEVTYGPADIRSYGVGSITELLDELAPQIRSDRGSGGAPVVLLDGKRISGFSEIRDLPTEAIARVEILPEEVALKYGYPADQKVVNIVLRRRFRAATVELSDKLATEGGRNAPQAELDLLKIANKGRVNLHLEYLPLDALTEAERGISPTTRTPMAGVTTVTVPGYVTDQTPYRTLLPSGRTFNGNATYARSFGNVSGTLNGTVSASDTTGLLGLPTVALTLPAGSPFSAGGETVDRTLGDGFAPLKQRTSSIAGHLGTTFNGALSKSWQWSLTGTYDHNESKTFTDTGLDATAFQARLNAGDPTANPFGPLRPGQLGAAAATRAYSTSDEEKIDLLLNGTVFKLPAGAVSTSLHVGGDISDLDSRSYRGAIFTPGDISRKILNGQLNVDVPLTSRAKNVLAAIGSLSVNGNVAVNYYSDFGTLTTLGYGLNWSPIVPLRIIGSVTDQDNAPTAAQLGNPQIATPNVNVFDYVRGTNALVTTITGGNPNLIASHSLTRKLSFTLKPWSAKDLSLSANYIDQHVDNPIAAFPSASAAIEAAFPTRFTRDADGDLQRIDERSINFAESSRSELRWGINFSMPLKSKLQKQIEAWRAGKGPNPFAGLKLPDSVRRQIEAARAARGDRGPGDGGPPPGDGGPGGGPGGGAPGGGFGGRGGGFGGGGFGGGGFGGRGAAQAGGRLQFALYHTWHFTDRVLVQQGGPALDLLHGDAIGSSGGQPQHELEGQAGYSNNGIGVRLSANWQSATTVNGGTVGNPETLHFSDLGTISLRVFGDLGQRIDLVKAHPWIRGVRVALFVDNIFDTRQHVTDASGSTPVAYQPGYLNPLGRTVKLTVRKLFF